MEVIIQETADSGCALGARIIAKLVREKPDAVLGLATGRTPLQLYQELIRLHRDEKLDFSHVTTFNLDEYVGLPRIDGAGNNGLWYRIRVGHRAR
jgi:glucosamine-6-phosphate deaminase